MLLTFNFFATLEYIVILHNFATARNLFNLFTIQQNYPLISQSNNAKGTDKNLGTFQPIVNIARFYYSK